MVQAIKPVMNSFVTVQLNQPSNVAQDMVKYISCTLKNEYLSDTPVSQEGVLIMQEKSNTQQVVNSISISDTQYSTSKTTKPRKPYEKRGSVFKRGSTWTFIYYVPDPSTGKKKSIWKGGYKTKKEAEIELKQIEAEIIMGTYIVDKKNTLEQYLLHWFEHHKDKLQPNTRSGYWNNITNHIIPNIGQIPLCNLTKHDVNLLFKTLLDKGLSSTSVKYVRSVLRKALNDAVGDGLIIKNPVVFAEAPKQKKYKATILNAEQAKELLKAANESSIFLEVLIAITFGMRRGEVLALKFSDFDFKKNKLHVERQLTSIRDKSDPDYKQKPMWGLKDLKTEGSNRVLDVPPSVIQQVMQRKKLVAQQKLLYGAMYNDMDLVFCDEFGNWISPQTVYHRFKAILKQFNFPDMRFHDLRHTCASILLDSEVPLKVIQEVLGHSSISTTADIYCEIIDAKKQATTTMESVLFA